MFQNAIATLGTQPADVPYAITSVGSEYYLSKKVAQIHIFVAIRNADERIATQR
jgi:hypothetical protein